MSMLKDWKDLLESGVDVGDYGQAIKHYTSLKNKMISQFKDRVLASKVSNQYQNLLDQFEIEILNEASEFSQLPARQVLNKIEEVVKDLIEKEDTSQLVSFLQEIRDNVQSKEGKIKDQQSYLKDQLKRNQDKIFSLIGKDKSFINNMLNVGNTSGDINDLANQASSYFIRFLYSQLFSDNSILKSNFKYIMSMSGYYKELAEYELLEKVLSQYLQVVHAGGIKINGKDTEMDIFITSLTNKMEALNRNAEIIEKIKALPNDSDIEILRQQLLQDINWFGEQVKSSKLGTSETFKIGNRKELFEAFQASAPSNKYSTLESAQFLSQFKNILLSLGVSNVLFSQNKKRQWMADFISDFRQQNYILTFFRQTDKSPLTNTVALQQIYIKGKKNLKRRFSI